MLACLVPLIDHYYDLSIFSLWGNLTSKAQACPIYPKSPRELSPPVDKDSAEVVMVNTSDILYLRGRKD
jgi:hypothetical protein